MMNGGRPKSSTVNLFSSISAGICALWGALHGGANEACVNMLEMIQADGGDLGKYIDRAKDSNDPFRLMGFGHRIYKNYDPRAKVIKGVCEKLLSKYGVQDPIFDLAQELESVALNDPYFVERKLYPNVDFYSGIIYSALGIEPAMFTPIFAVSRMAGWVARILEYLPKNRIFRPRAVYTGPMDLQYKPIEQRG